MTKHKKPTEAERIFIAFCDGYLHKLSVPLYKSPVDLHRAAKAYVNEVLKLNQDEQNDD